MPPIRVGYWAQNSLNKRPFFGRLSVNNGRVFQKLAKKSKNGSFSQKFVIRVGMMAGFVNKKRTAF